MATPRVAVSRGEILVAVRNEVLAVGLDGGSRRLITAPGPVRAIAADRERVGLLVAPERDDDPWTFAVAPRDGGDARPLASFERRPFHRHPLVLARGHVCTIVGDRVVGAPW